MGLTENMTDIVIIEDSGVYYKSKALGRNPETLILVIHP